jgi:hypothetical protein
MVQGISKVFASYFFRIYFNVILDDGTVFIQKLTVIQMAEKYSVSVESEVTLLYPKSPLLDSALRQ